ncbi:MAG: metal ABC transporter permease [archaeon]
MDFGLLGSTFVQRAVIAGIMSAIIAGTIGAFLVQRRLSLLADSLAHTSFGGIALGIYLGVNPLISALVVSILGAVTLSELKRRTTMSGDAMTAVIFSSGLALGVIVVSLGKGFTVNVFGFLFGSILLVGFEDLLITTTILVSILLVIALFYKELVYMIFDEEGARASGVPVTGLDYLLIGLASAAVVGSIRAVGVLLISALIVMPNLAAAAIARSFKESIFIAQTFAVISVLTGILVSFYLNLAGGAAIALSAILIFAGTTVAKQVWTRFHLTSPKN